MADHDERYYCKGRLGAMSAGNNTSACRDCGAVVYDTEKHDEEHGRLDAIERGLRAVADRAV